MATTLALRFLPFLLFFFMNGHGIGASRDLKVELHEKKEVESVGSTPISRDEPYSTGSETTSDTTQPNYIASYTFKEHNHPSHHGNLNEPYITTPDSAKPTAHEANQAGYSAAYKSPGHEANQAGYTGYSIAYKSPAHEANQAGYRAAYKSLGHEANQASYTGYSVAYKSPAHGAAYKSAGHETNQAGYTGYSVAYKSPIHEVNQAGYRAAYKSAGHEANQGGYTGYSVAYKSPTQEANQAGYRAAYKSPGHKANQAGYTGYSVAYKSHAHEANQAGYRAAYKSSGHEANQGGYTGYSVAYKSPTHEANQAGYRAAYKSPGHEANQAGYTGYSVAYKSPARETNQASYSAAYKSSGHEANQAGYTGYSVAYKSPAHSAAYKSPGHEANQVGYTGYDAAYKSASHEANQAGYNAGYKSSVRESKQDSKEPTQGYAANYKTKLEESKGVPSSNVDHTEAFEKGMFTLDDLYVGNVMALQFPVQELSHFLPRKEADSIPFSSSQLSSVLQLFSISEDSALAQSMRGTLEQCEAETVTGETKTCVNSLESMLEFVGTILGSEAKYDILTTSHPTPSAIPLQKYTILEVSQDIYSPKWVACHPLPYPYAVYYCHFIATGSKVFKVFLSGENGDKMEALGICHLDTSDWSPDQNVFRMLGMKPGEAPVCHFIPVKHLMWVPQPSTATK